MGPDYKALGKRIRELRTGKKMTQIALANLVGIESSNISHIESGTSKAGFPTLVNIANALGVTLDSLMRDSLVVERAAFEGELAEVIKDCDTYELRVLTDAVLGLKTILRSRKNLIEYTNTKKQEED